MKPSVQSVRRMIQAIGVALLLIGIARNWLVDEPVQPCPDDLDCMLAQSVPPNALGGLLANVGFALVLATLLIRTRAEVRAQLDAAELHRAELRALLESVLRRSDYRCRDCGSTDAAVYYAGSLTQVSLMLRRQRENPANMVVLCARHAGDRVDARGPLGL